MTGNTVMLGPALAMGQLSQAALLLTPIPLFVLGIMLGVATIRMLGAAWVRSLLLAGIWLCFFGGALSGAYAGRLLLATSLVAPIVALLILSVVEWVDPTVSARRLASGPS
jgi:uncharacterized membrane protein YoaK (UPF0700 family)